MWHINKCGKILNYHNTVYRFPMPKQLLKLTVVEAADLTNTDSVGRFKREIFSKINYYTGAAFRVSLKAVRIRLL